MHDEDRGLGVPKQMMAVWPDNTDQLVDVRVADNGELNTFVVVLEEVGDVVVSGDRVHVNIGITMPQLTDPTVELVIGVACLHLHGENW